MGRTGLMDNYDVMDLYDVIRSRFHACFCFVLSYVLEPVLILIIQFTYLLKAKGVK